MLTSEISFRGFSSDTIRASVSTPKKAVSSEASLIQCLICAESLENNQRIAVFGRLHWDLRETFSKNLGGELKKEMFSTADKGCKDELREVPQKKTVRIKRGLSEEVSVAPSFEAARINYFKSPMQSLNKTLFPSSPRENPTRFPLAVLIVGYQTARPSVPVV